MGRYLCQMALYKKFTKGILKESIDGKGLQVDKVNAIVLNHLKRFENLGQKLKSDLKSEVRLIAKSLGKEIS